MKHKKIYLFLFCSLLFLTSCNSNPEISAKTEIVSAQYLNPDINGQAEPIVLSLYQLTSPNNFNQASYNDLEENSAKALGTELIDKQTLEIKPNSTQQLLPQLSARTRYIGVIAGYRDINHANWRQLLTLTPDAKKIRLNIYLDSQTLTAKLLP